MNTCPNCNQPHISCSDSAALSRIEQSLAQLQLQMKRLLTMSEPLAAEIATETTQEAALAAAVTQNTALLTSLQATATALQAALTAAQATNNGVTPDELAAFDAVHQKVAADIAALTPAAPAA